MNEAKLFRIRPVPPADAPEEKVIVLIDKRQAEQHGIQLDEVGWPTLESLAAWHAKNNPPAQGMNGKKP